MATVDPDVRSPDALSPSTSEKSAVDSLVDAMTSVTLEHANPEDVRKDKTSNFPPRPLKVYGRHDILLLSKSPLVKPPQGMPALKEWFG